MKKCHFKTMQQNTTIQGNSYSVLKTFADNSADMCVTSPPYWGLRDYGVPATKWPRFTYTLFGFTVKVKAWKGCYGLEPTPEMFIAHSLQIFNEVKRVLKPHGTLWLNIGDNYHNKSLSGIPWMLAFAMREAGWYLRQDIIWHKPNPMPESVTDRCTKAHEYIFLFSKSQRYFYDAEAIKEEASGNTNLRASKTEIERVTKEREAGANSSVGIGGANKSLNDGKTKTNDSFQNACCLPVNKANKRSVWLVNSEALPEAHFATFPQSLIEPCIKAGSSLKGVCPACGKPWVRLVQKSGGSIGKGSWTKHEADIEQGMRGDNSNTESKASMRDGTYKVETIGWQPTCTCTGEHAQPLAPVPALVLDPFHGSGTTGIVSRKLARNFIGIELNPAYIGINNKRKQKELGMFQ
jgi:DNA modification methylase